MDSCSQLLFSPIMLQQGLQHTGMPIPFPTADSSTLVDIDRSNMSRLDPSKDDKGRPCLLRQPATVLRLNVALPPTSSGPRRGMGARGFDQAAISGPSGPVILSQGHPVQSTSRSNQNAVQRAAVDRDTPCSLPPNQLRLWTTHGLTPRTVCDPATHHCAKPQTPLPIRRRQTACGVFRCPLFA